MELRLPDPIRHVGWLIVALLSTAIWLGVSSLYDSAGFQLVKSAYSTYPFGSVSAKTLGVCAAWTLVIGVCHLMSTTLAHWTRFLLGGLVVLFWVGIVTSINILAMEVFAQLGIFREVIWLWIPICLLEVGVAGCIISRAIEPLPYHGFERAAFIMTETFTLLTAAKALLLWLTPGILIRP